MQKSMWKVLSVFAAVAIVFTCWAMVPASEAGVVDRGGPPGGCCDPAAEPGVGGNPLCFEGHSCCASGNWSCNNPDGSPSCDPGEVCDPDCGGRNDSCSADEDCCSGICKPNGRCK